MRVLILGASGAMGTRTCTELARSSQVEGLILAARDEASVDRMASAIGARASTVQADSTDGVRLREAMSGADVVVSCLGPAYRCEASAAEAAIDAGVPYVSLSDDHQATEAVLALDERARRAGVTVVSGCGLSPGITNLLALIAAARVDEVEEIELSVAASSADGSGQASAVHVLAMMSAPAVAVSDGIVTSERSGTVPTLVYFPEPTGWIETFNCGHPEILTLVRWKPGIRTVRFRFGLSDRAVMDAVRAISALQLASTDRRRRLLTRLTKPVTPLLRSLSPRTPAWTSARVDVHGLREGRRTTVSLAVVDHLPTLAAVPLSEAAVRLGGATVRQPGVHGPEAVFDAPGFLGSIADKGVRIAELEPEPV